MKKKHLLILSLSFVLMVANLPKATAQIFIVDDNEFIDIQRNRINPSQLPAMPGLGQTNDQYGPLGGEMLVLGCLGGAYLLGKRKKRKD